jgi:hypothetical protein
MSFRQSPRIVTDLDATIVTNSGATKVYPVKIAELSYGGALLNGYVGLGLGREVTLEVTFPWGTLNVTCKVLHMQINEEKLCTGVCFEHGDDGPPECLVGYIKEKLPKSVKNIME